MNNDLPHVPLPADELERHLVVLRTGNSLMAKWAVRLFGPRSMRHLRLLLLGGKALQNIVPPKQRDEFYVDLPKMRATKDCEVPVLLSHVNLAYSLARRCMRRACRTMMTIDDLKSESVIGLREGIYHYHKEGIRFTTFASRCCLNAITTAITRLSPLGNFTKVERKLFIQFKREQISSDLTFEEICGRLGLNKEQVHVITQMSQDIAFSNATVSGDGDEVMDDYTADRMDAEKDLSGVPRDDFEFWEAIEALHLNNFERDVIETAMHQQRGWQAAVASKHINPRTERPFSRAAVKEVLKRISSRLHRLGLDLPEVD